MTVATDLERVQSEIQRTRCVQRREAFVALGINLFIGLGLFVGAPSRTSSPVFVDTIELLSFVSFYPMRVFGVLLTVFSVAGLIAMQRRRFTPYRIAMFALAGWWSYWMLAFSINLLLDPIGSFIAVGLAFAFSRRHFVASGVERWVIEG